jgi:hypothetical protein
MARTELEETFIAQAMHVLDAGVIYAATVGLSPALKSSYVSGVWLGLSIGITDVVAARKLRDLLVEMVEVAIGDEEAAQEGVEQLVSAALRP